MLTRKFGQSVVIGENIVVTVVRIEGGKIRLAIDAPEAVPVFRSEVIEEMKGRQS